ncbi:hypothetical protein DFJ73DRAFT_780410 [Zopfochytrium polystomum]|nr:hypothetical protein DFJ73DRAFT_780410 [Zopfochytrium polystomum]
MHFATLLAVAASAAFLPSVHAVPTSPGTVDLGGATVTLAQLKTILRDPFAVVGGDVSTPYTLPSSSSSTTTFGLSASVVETVLAGNQTQEAITKALRKGGGGGGLSRRGGGNTCDVDCFCECECDCAIAGPAICGGDAGNCGVTHVCYMCESPDDNAECHQCYYGN